MRKFSAVCSAALLASLFSLGSLSSLGCGSDDEGGGSAAYATLQLCVDALKGPEGGKDTKTSIAECIRDKTIGGAKLSFTTKADCVSFVTTNTTGFMANAIDQGCQMYLDSK
jgi:hypothetical protein